MKSTVRCAPNNRQAWGERWAEKHSSQRLKHAALNIRVAHSHAQHTHYHVNITCTTLNTTSRWQRQSAARPQMWRQSCCWILHVKMNSCFLKGLGFPSYITNLITTHIYSAERTRLLIWNNTQKKSEKLLEESNEMGLCEVNSNARNAPFLNNSRFLHALNASWLEDPLGIASLMNANGKGLLRC